MRVLHLTDCYLPRVGGIEMHVRDLCRAQRGAGHDAAVVTATPAGRDAGAEAEADEEWVHRLHPRSTSLLSSVAGGPDLARVLERVRPDVIHAHVSVFSPFAVAGARQASRAGLPVLVTVHSMWSGSVRPVLRPLLLGLDREPVTWSAVSHRAAGPVRAVLGDDSPILVLPNAVDPGWWQVAHRPDTTATIVSVMRLARRKRPLSLARMLRRVRAELPAGTPLRAVIVGDGPQRSALQSYLDRHAMTWVELPGRLGREEIRTLHGGASLYAAPATLESFGIAALEARCAGLPVVASTRGGVGEFVSDGREGLLARDDDDMVAAMLRLVTDAGLRRSMGAHNRTVISRLDWAAACSASLNAYAVAGHRTGSDTMVSIATPAAAGRRP